jgi:hypothetical protein
MAESKSVKTIDMIGFLSAMLHLCRVWLPAPLSLERAEAVPNQLKQLVDHLAGRGKASGVPQVRESCN